MRWQGKRCETLRDQGRHRGRGRGGIQSQTGRQEERQRGRNRRNQAERHRTGKRHRERKTEREAESRDGGKETRRRLAEIQMGKQGEMESSCTMCICTVHTNLQDGGH